MVVEKRTEQYGHSLDLRQLQGSSNTFLLARAADRATIRSHRQLDLTVVLDLQNQLLRTTLVTKSPTS